jgi:hypothetical protein
MRFLWDAFDDRNDTARDTYSAGNTAYWEHASLMQFYDTGTGLYDHEEPWNGAKTTVSFPNDQPNGRGATSYQWSFNSTLGQNMSALRGDNCSIPRAQG